MIKYQYQVIRYIHDQFTGEFGNVGIVLFSPEKDFLACKVVNRYARLSEFFGHINGQFLLAGLRQFEKLINEIGQNVAGYLNDRNVQPDLVSITSSILPKDDSALQLTEAVWGLDVDPELTLIDLFERIIEKYNAEEPQSKHTDQYAWRKVYKNYFDQYGITKKLKKHTVPVNNIEINFDKAWKNGVWHCYQPLSLDLKSKEAIESKVFKWSGIIRALEANHEKLNLYFLTTAPKEHKELEDFINNTLSVQVNGLKVNIIEEEAAEAFAARVRMDMEDSNVIEGDEMPF
jgi:hypothetical protein